MDPTLVTGLLSIAGTASTGALGLMGLLVKRHMAFLDSMTSNHARSTVAIEGLTSAVLANNALYQGLVVRVEGVENTIVDNRNAEALAQSKEATILMRASLDTIKTGQHAAVTVARVDAVPDLEESGRRPRVVPR